VRDRLAGCWRGGGASRRIDRAIPDFYPAAPLELRACDDARNLRRCYVIEVSRDLFGTFIVQTSWRRLGAAGRSKRETFDDLSAAEACARTHLRRRATAVRRIGIPYVTVSATPTWAKLIAGVPAR
jgi:predicted DNA-binding WGR domain protein